MNASRGLLRHPDFIKLWAAQSISAFGSRISRTALPIVAIVTIGASPAQIGILSALAVAPRVVVGLLAGGFIDRSAKRPVLVSADLVRAGLLLTIPAAAWFGFLDMTQLYIVAAGVGAATALFEIADNAYLPALVGKSSLVEANTRLEATDAVAEIAGPSVTGALVAIMSAPFTILVDAASYIISAAFLGSIRASEPAPEHEAVPPSLVRDLIAGFRAGFGHPLVRPVFLVEGTVSFFGGFFYALYMLYLLEHLHLSAGVVGVLIGLGGVGALLGAVIAQPLPRLLGLGPAMILLVLFGQAAAFLIPLARGPHWVVLGCLAGHQIVSDGLIVAYAIHATSLRQTVLPLGILGRANAARQVFTGILLPTGALLAGWLATILDVRTTIWIAVLCGLAAPLFLALSPLRSLREMPALPQLNDCHPERVSEGSDGGKA